MKRLAIGAALAGVVVSGFASPASAELLGNCDGKIDVACTFWTCVPSEDPCTASPVCLVWYYNRCLT